MDHKAEGWKEVGVTAKVVLEGVVKEAAARAVVAMGVEEREEAGLVAVAKGAVALAEAV